MLLRALYILVLLTAPLALAQTTVQPHVMAWDPPNPESSEAPDEYCIYRTVNGGAWTLVTCVPATTLTYTDSSLTFGNRYCYRGTTRKGASESAAIPTEQIFCLSALPTTGR